MLDWCTLLAPNLPWLLLHQMHGPKTFLVHLYSHTEEIWLNIEVYNLDSAYPFVITNQDMKTLFQYEIGIALTNSFQSSAALNNSSSFLVLLTNPFWICSCDCTELTKNHDSELHNLSWVAYLLFCVLQVGPSTFFSSKQFEVFDVELLSIQNCERRTIAFYSDVVCNWWMYLQKKFLNCFPIPSITSYKNY